VTTGTAVGNPFTGHTDWANAVAVGHLDGRAIIVSGGDDATVWEPDSSSITISAIRAGRCSGRRFVASIQRR